MVNCNKCTMLMQDSNNRKNCVWQVSEIFWFFSSCLQDGCCSSTHHVHSETGNTAKYFSEVFPAVSDYSELWLGPVRSLHCQVNFQTSLWVSYLLLYSESSCQWYKQFTCFFGQINFWEERKLDAYLLGSEMTKLVLYPAGALGYQGLLSEWGKWELSQLSVGQLHK